MQNFQLNSLKKFLIHAVEFRGFYTGFYMPKEFDCASHIDHDEHVTAQAESLLPNRRAS